MALTDENSGTGFYMPVQPMGGNYGGYYPAPVYYGNNGNGGFGNDSFVWLILFILLVGNNNWGNNGNSYGRYYNSYENGYGNNSYDNGNNGNSYDGRGRTGNVRRDSMGRYATHNQESMDEIMERMYKLMDNAPNEKMRSELDSLMQKMKMM